MHIQMGLSFVTDPTLAFFFGGGGGGGGGGGTIPLPAQAYLTQ